jgi:hypothetical protein
VVRNHPAIRQIHGLVELHGDDLGVYLHYDTFHPAAHAVAVVILMVTIDFNPVAYRVEVITVRCCFKAKISQYGLLE